MDESRFRQADELFREALDYAPAEREKFLRDACGDDAELLAEVESLLQHDARAPDDFMQTAGAPEGQDSNPEETAEFARPDLPIAQIPQIEGYEIVRELGRGGQAVVYEAF
jgi:serine/threonine-protein kinase